MVGGIKKIAWGMLLLSFGLFAQKRVPVTITKGDTLVKLIGYQAKLQNDGTLRMKPVPPSLFSPLKSVLKKTVPFIKTTTLQSSQTLLFISSLLLAEAYQESSSKQSVPYMNSVNWRVFEEKAKDVLGSGSLWAGFLGEFGTSSLASPFVNTLVSKNTTALLLKSTILNLSRITLSWGSFVLFSELFQTARFALHQECMLPVMEWDESGQRTCKELFERSARIRQILFSKKAADEHLLSKLILHMYKIITFQNPELADRWLKQTLYFGVLSGDMWCIYALSTGGALAGSLHSGGLSFVLGGVGATLGILIPQKHKDALTQEAFHQWKTEHMRQVRMSQRFMQKMIEAQDWEIQDASKFVSFGSGLPLKPLMKDSWMDVLKHRKKIRNEIIHSSLLQLKMLNIKISNLYQRKKVSQLIRKNSDDLMVLAKQEVRTTREIIEKYTQYESQVQKEIDVLQGYAQNVVDVLRSFLDAEEKDLNNSVKNICLLKLCPKNNVAQVQLEKHVSSFENVKIFVTTFVLDFEENYLEVLRNCQEDQKDYYAGLESFDPQGESLVLIFNGLEYITFLNFDEDQLFAYYERYKNILVQYHSVLR